MCIYQSPRARNVGSETFVCYERRKFRTVGLARLIYDYDVRAVDRLCGW
jgi:hypothetical protein